MCLMMLSSSWIVAILTKEHFEFLEILFNIWAIAYENIEVLGIEYGNKNSMLLWETEILLVICRTKDYIFIYTHTWIITSI